MLNPIPLPISSSMSLLVILVVLWANISHGFEINLQIPKVFKVTSPMWINCTLEYVKEDEVVSEIKWYKNDQLFYTWDHEKKEGVQIMLPEIGIDHFDLDKSTGNAIYLTSTELNSTGCYECEVILENGESKKKSAKTQAFFVDMYKPRPFIHVETLDGLLVRDFYIRDMWDYFTVRCTSKPSFPDAEVSLLINGRDRNLNYDEEKVVKKQYRVHSEDYKRYNLVNYFVVHYTFQITPGLVEGNFMKVACLATVRAPHGMIEQLESDEKRIRVIATYRQVSTLPHIENKKYWLVGFLGIVLGLVGLWYIVDGNSDRDKDSKKTVQQVLDEEEEDNVSNKSSYDYAIKIRRESVAAGTFETLAADALKMRTGGPIPDSFSSKMTIRKGSKNVAVTVSGPQVAMTDVPLNDEPGRGERIV